MLSRVVSGALFARLRSLSDRIVARELPILSRPQCDAEAIGYTAGVIDLVYRDPQSDELVVVDYKTDRLANKGELEHRSRAYSRQGAIYQHALRDALELAYTPRFELWFLSADQIVDLQ